MAKVILTDNVTGTDFDNGSIRFNSCHFVKKERYDQDKNIQVKNGSILITKDGTLGKVAYVENLNKPATLNAGVFNVKTKGNDVDNKYLFQYLKAPFLMKYVDEKSTGGTIKHLNQSILVNFPVVLPGVEEQRKIGEFLSHIDSILTLHQRKYEKLLNIKKSMLEKMFPKEGEVVPEIRFKGFTGAWEQRKFSKLYKRSSEKNDGSIGIERNITVATMQFKSDIRLSSDDYLKTYFTFKVGDIAFEGHQSKEFRYGRFVENDIGDGIVSHIFTVFRPIQRFNLHFWKYAINSENLMQKILSRSTKASTMMHDLVPEDFLNETFLVPSIDEQKAVGKFLHQIDNLLTLHQRKLEMLKNVKQAFLEKMFV